MEEVIKMIGYCTVGLILIGLLFKACEFFISLTASTLGILVLFILGICLIKLGRQMMK